MKPFETLAEATTPDGHSLTLHRRGNGFFILLQGEELMATRAPGSERALAELGCRGLPAPKPRVLVGGLGLGFTLRAALDELPGGAKVVVAELMEAVIDWNRYYLPDLQNGALTDRRTEIVHADAWQVIRKGAPWDAILLDVDNGPEACCLEANGRLYDRTGLEEIRQSLVPGGRLAVWSAYPDPAFVRRLEKAGFSAKAHHVRSRGDKGHRHTIFLGQAPEKPLGERLLPKRRRRRPPR